MKIQQVAAQLYTLRDFIKTPADIATTMKKVRAIGYEAVQVSGMGPISEEELVRILKGEGLTCCATHEPAEKILKDPSAIIARLRKLGCRYTAYAYPSGIDLADPAAVHDLATALNASGQMLQEAGQVLCYHNHHVEFRRVKGRLILDIIYDETDPRYLQGEIDTYWVQYGGGDPVAWCRKLKERLPLLHLKDYLIDAENKIIYGEIGRGNLNWKEIIAAAEAAGCEWYIVEQDVCPVDPFESLKISYDYIKEQLCT